MSLKYLACDLGAESVRLMLGRLSSGHLDVEEIYRFPNTPIQEGSSLRWDMPALFEGLKGGLRQAASRDETIKGISTDSWGVDYLLLDEQGNVIEPTYHYRDPRIHDGVQKVFRQLDWPMLFEETGIQFMPINTIYQLATESPERLGRAERLLGIGDGFNYFLSGRAIAEVSLASTTQLYNPRTNAWSDSLLEALGLPKRLFPEIVPTGTRLGELRPELANETGFKGSEVIATCSHDTGAAVAAVPTTKRNWAYLSSGTWSLMGTELNQPLLTDRCRDLNYTNEIGYGGTIRLLKNIIGLWLVQECRRYWAGEGKNYSYEELADMAQTATPFVSLIHPGDPRFISPGEMPQKIAAFCREAGQPVPETIGAMMRCIFESLALLYRKALEEIEELTETKIERLHIVGGGSQNALLNRFTANATQVPVLTGPVEATAIGNILVQAITLGDLDSLHQGREVVAQSFDVQMIEPSEAAIWQEAYERFREMTG